MTYLAWSFLALALVRAGLRLYTKKYIFSALTTACCLVVSLVSGAQGAWWVVVGLAASVIGDYFMNRKDGFLFGIIGFFCAHVCFLCYSASRFGAFPLWCIICAVCMCACYAVFLWLCVYPREPNMPIKCALTLYMLISVSAFTLSFGVRPYGGAALAFSTGIFCILFSDTLIGLSKYVKMKWADQWVLPTYYLCHLLIAFSFAIQMT